MAETTNETLSPKQVTQIRTQFETIIKSTVQKVQEKFNDFFVTMKKEWEDQYAVELSEKLKKSMAEVTTHLQDNCNAFTSTLEEIANAYHKTGNMGSMSVTKISTGTLTITAKIEKTFDGDMFGFKDVTSHSKISQALQELIQSLKSIISEAQSQISGINAFGNTNVTQNLGKSAGKIIEIMQNAISQVKTSTDENLSAAATAYQTTGQSAVTAAKIETSE